MFRRKNAFPLAILTAGLLSAFAQTNTAPIVDAGKDTTIRLPSSEIIDKYRMQGAVEDDGLPNNTLTTLWSQVSGPSTGAEIEFKDSPNSRIRLTGIGTYVFKLSATDGILSDSDTVIFTIIDSLRFIVKTPAAGEKVYIGDSVLVTWQFNQITDFQISLSTNNGLSYEMFDTKIYDKQEWMWHVSDTLQESANCIIKINKYGFANIKTLSAKFSLVKGPRPNAIKHIPKTSVRKIVSLNISSDVFALDGRQISSHNSGALGNGVVVRRVKGSRTLKTVLLP